MWAKTLLELLFLPPAAPLLILGLGLFLILFRRYRSGSIVAFIGFGLAYAGSIPAVVYPLAHSWESNISPLRVIPKNAQAIVVIGGGSRPAPAYGDGDTVTLLTLQRVRYAAYLAKHSGNLPILVSGGRDWFGEQDSEAQLMSRVLVHDFHLKPRWQDINSRTTWGNANQSARLLVPKGIKHVLLVTQAWHMPRALWVFRRAGLDPIPAPVGFIHRGWTQKGILGWVPQAKAAIIMAEIAHEVMGLVWYHLRA